MDSSESISHPPIGEINHRMAKVSRIRHWLPSQGKYIFWFGTFYEVDPLVGRLTPPPRWTEWYMSPHTTLGTKLWSQASIVQQTERMPYHKPDCKVE